MLSWSFDAFLQLISNSQNLFEASGPSPPSTPIMFFLHPILAFFIALIAGIYAMYRHYGTDFDYIEKKLSTKTT